MSFSAKADMDKICYVDLFADTKIAGVTIIMDALIQQECERNNILQVIGVNTENEPILYQRLVASYCRYDRNVVKTPVGFTCVLYDWRPRTNKR